MNPLINFVRFQTLDGLSMQTPWGKPGLPPPKAWRTLRSALLQPGQEDARPPPDPEKDREDFRRRTREYHYVGVEREEETGILVAVYQEA